MGTNYYVRTCDSPCAHCTADRDGIHLGKSSGGWRFLARADPAWPREQAFTEWLKLATSGQIYNEYGDRESIGELLTLIHSKRELRSHLEGLDHTTLGTFAADGHEFTARDFS